jgi:hypothetical protein
VGVDADLDVVRSVGDLAHDALDLVGQGAAVGVAQHEVSRRPLLGGRLEHPQRELGVVLVAVEEVLGVEEHPQAGGLEERDRLGHHRDALVERGAQRLGHVEVRALADDAHRRRAGVDQVAQGGVVVDLAQRLAGGAERHQRRRRQRSSAGPPEELLVLRVGSGPAALDPVHAEPVELLGDAQLVVDRERDALELGTVAQRRVEDLDGLGESGVACRHHRRLGDGRTSVTSSVTRAPPTCSTYLYGRSWPRTALAYSSAMAAHRAGARDRAVVDRVDRETSAAVPHTNISSATYRSLRARSATTTSNPRSGRWS